LSNENQITEILKKIFWDWIFWLLKFFDASHTQNVDEKVFSGSCHTNFRFSKQISYMQQIACKIFHTNCCMQILICNIKLECTERISFIDFSRGWKTLFFYRFVSFLDIQYFFLFVSFRFWFFSFRFFCFVSFGCVSSHLLSIHHC
jgi:hypothetical protein